MSTPIYVLITGVSPGGLGDALTTELLKRPNIHVLASGLETNHLSHLPRSDRISRLQLDVTSPSSVSEAVETVNAITGGRLNYLINNAGYGYVKQNFEVNVFGLLAVTQAFFPLLRVAKGTVVNQCSIASLPGARQPYIGIYCATKAAMASLNDTMRVEFAPFAVNVSCHCLMLAGERLCTLPARLILGLVGHLFSYRRCTDWVLGQRDCRSKRLADFFAIPSDRRPHRTDDARRHESVWSTLA
jgi:NADP-dependent 3-hydroxy acid dehydrogenase YdfG